MNNSCRICGKYDWSYLPPPRQLTARGIHESAHVRRGEAIFTGEGKERIVVPTDLGKQLFNGQTQVAQTNSKAGFGHIRMLQEGTQADRIRKALPTMPTEFTVRDVVAKVPNITSPSASAALRWANRTGIIKYVRQYTPKEWRAQGHVGNPPVIYTFVGFDHFKHKPKMGRPPKTKGELVKGESREVAPQAIDTAALAAVLEEPIHQCEATDVLANVQRSLGTLNLLIAIQSLPPEQIVALSGTISALGQTARRGRR